MDKEVTVLTHHCHRSGFAMIALVVIGLCLAPGCPSTMPPDNDGDGGDGGGMGGGDGGDDVDNTTGKVLSRFETDNFLGSANCVVCHGGLMDEEGNDVSNGTHWRSTMMANAAKDPFWQAKVMSELIRNPNSSIDIEDKCATCHMPMARTQAVADGLPSGIFSEGFLNEMNPLHEAAMDGVSCSLCHQVQDVGLGEKPSFSGNYTIDTDAQSIERLIFGPYSDPLQGPMQSSVGFTPTYAEHIMDSGHCATCHTLFTPVLNEAGEVTGEFPEQVAYLEWEHSDFGDGVDVDRSCQECHMPEAIGEVIISNTPRDGLVGRSPFFQHHFVGGNSFMLKVLKAHIAELGLTASAQNFDDTIARTENQLQNLTGDLSLMDLDTVDGTLMVTVRVSNLAGHKFPTGYPARQAWIHLAVMDGSDQVVFESGQPQADGSITGNDADVDGTAFEPHYEVITASDEVQIYEAIMANAEGAVTYTALRAASYAKDNRLLPEGFDKGTASGDVAVAGAAASDENFLGGSDQVTYMIDLPNGVGPYMVTAKLLYSSLSYQFMKNLRQDSDPVIDRFADYYDEADKTPVVVDMVQELVP